MASSAARATRATTGPVPTQPAVPARVAASSGESWSMESTATDSSRASQAPRASAARAYTSAAAKPTSRPKVSARMVTVSWSSAGTACGASSMTTSRTVRTRPRVCPRVMVPVKAAGATEKIRLGTTSSRGVSTESTNMVTPRRATASIWRRGASGRVRYQGCSALMRSRECSIMAFCARRSESTAGRLRSSMTGSYSGRPGPPRPVQPIDGAIRPTGPCDVALAAKQGGNL